MNALNEPMVTTLLLTESIDRRPDVPPLLAAHLDLVCIRTTGEVGGAHPEWLWEVVVCLKVRVIKTPVRFRSFKNHLPRVTILVVKSGLIFVCHFGNDDTTVMGRVNFTRRRQMVFILYITLKEKSIAPVEWI